MRLEACWNRWLFWQKARRSLQTGTLQCHRGKWQSPVSKKSLSGIVLKASPVHQRSFELLCPSLHLVFPLSHHICWKKLGEDELRHKHQSRKVWILPWCLLHPAALGRRRRRGNFCCPQSPARSVPGRCLMGISAAGAGSALPGGQAGLAQDAPRCWGGRVDKLLAEDPFWNSCWL